MTNLEMAKELFLKEKIISAPFLQRVLKVSAHEGLRLCKELSKIYDVNILCIERKF